MGVFNTKFQIKFFGFLCSIFEMYFWTDMGNKEFFKGQAYGKMSESLSQLLLNLVVILLR